MRLTVPLVVCLTYAKGAVSDTDAEKVFQPMLIIVEKDNGQTLDVRVGESVWINLPENATTGYRWAIDRYDDEFIEAVATEPRYTENAIGSGGEVAFSFRARKTGTGEIILKHWRHWEGDLSVTRRFCLRLNVRP